MQNITNNRQLSLCIPTNGMSKWVVPLLDSIYNQDYDDSKFEVIITDNGCNDSFINDISEYLEKHQNIIYKKTNSYLFENQIDCFKLASGSFVKFLNHRFLMRKDAIAQIIEYVNKYSIEKPIIYFANMALKINKADQTLLFDDFIYEINYYITWSGGTSFWKSDFDYLFNGSSYDKYFPHINTIIGFGKSRKYVINNDKMFLEQSFDGANKGKYDLYDAFANHFISIMENVYSENVITYNTFNHVKNENLFFVMDLYIKYNILKRKCSYIIDNFSQYFFKKYSIFEFIYGFVYVLVHKFIKKIMDLINN